MLLVIFGAGASSDSVDPQVANAPFTQAEYKPPLANEMFLDREVYRQFVDMYPQVRGVLPSIRLRVARGEGVEAVLDDLFSQAHPDRPGQLLALRLYLRDVIATVGAKWNALANGLTNYSRLIEMLRATGESFAVVTFNYDLLFEEALRDRGITFDTMSSYIERPELSYLKVHGSVDWARVLVRSSHLLVNAKQDLSRAIFERPDSVRFQDDAFEKFTTMFQPDGHHQFPAIAVPLQAKTIFECPASHLSALDKLLPSVDRVLIVGWGANDQHFLERCRPILRPRRTLIVCGSRTWGAGTNLNWDRAIPGSNPSVFDGGFTDLFDPSWRDPDGLTWIGLHA